MVERVLLHICCGPCGFYPVRSLREEGFEVTGFFYNPNIHPYLEYLRRLEAVKKLSHALGLKMIWMDDYDLTGWLRMVCYHEGDRCRLCYQLRLSRVAEYAREVGFAYFTSSLLYSKRQRQEEIKRIAEELSREKGVNFLYRDFRSGWKEGIEGSKELGLYRQQYCGCIFSEWERYRTQKNINLDEFGR